DTTVLLTEETLLNGGKVVPKGSIVTVNGDAMKIVQPDGTIIKGSYTKAVADVKALPGGDGATATVSSPLRLGETKVINDVSMT
ncbi:hypothetical protein ACYT6H_10010, partial [Streptococcus pyogenes]